MDLILCSGQKAGEGAQARSALAKVYSADGATAKTAFQASVQRILTLKTGLGG